jgi:hypothetical protein
VERAAVSASALEDYARRARDVQEQLQGTSAPRPPVHYIRETEHGPHKETPCGRRLWEVVYDVGPRPPVAGEFRVHPLTGSGLPENVDCLSCLRKLAEASGAK